MLTIRLSRIGKKNKPMYRLIISEKARDPYGRALEILGSYNPHTKDLQAKADRIKYWLSQGSGMSSTVNNLLIEKGIIEGEKVKASKPKKKKKKGDVAKPEEKPKDPSAGSGQEKKGDAAKPEEKSAGEKPKGEKTEKTDEKSKDEKSKEVSEKTEEKSEMTDKKDSNEKDEKLSASVQSDSGLQRDKKEKDSGEEKVKEPSKEEKPEEKKS